MFELQSLGITEQAAWAATAALCFMVLDIISGSIAAVSAKELSSAKAREGLLHKSSFVLVIVMAWLCEFFVMHVPEIGFSVPVVVPACVLIIFTEILSVMENLAKINPDLRGSKLLGLFEQGGVKEMKSDGAQRD